VSGQDDAPGSQPPFRLDRHHRSVRILVVDDDRAVREAVGRALKQEGYEVDAAGNGDQALQQMEERPPDAVVLDVLMPPPNGLQVARSLRQVGDRTPILMLTARDAVEDRVEGLDAGADDYLVKPFALAELLARVAAVLRRAGQSRGGAAPAADRRIRFADIAIDLGTRTVTRGEQPIALTHLEFELLTFFCRNSRRVYSREELLREVWGSRHAGPARTVDNFVAQLRAKLEQDPEQPRHLLTVRGSGYRFAPE